MIPSLPIALFLTNVVALSLLRLAFYLAFHPHAIPPHDLAHAFYLGLKFDARLSAILSFPLLFFSSAIYVAIVEALTAGDGPLAVHRMRSHLQAMATVLE